MKVLKLHFFWEYKLVFEAWDMKCVEKMYEWYYLENYETRWQMVIFGVGISNCIRLTCLEHEWLIGN